MDDHCCFIEIDNIPNLSADILGLTSITLHILETLGLRNFELSCRFVDETTIAKLNFDFRQKNKPTDVLSFEQFPFETKITSSKPFSEGPLSSNLDSNGPPKILGDIVICPQIALQNAAGIGHSLGRETAFLITHGVLHLCGHDHQEPAEAEEMYQEQRIILNSIIKEKSKMLDDPQLIQIVEG